MKLDFVTLSNSFEAWMLSKPVVHSPENHVAALDGKRIRQPLTDANGKQRFVGLVSLFATQSGLTLKLEGLTEQANRELKVAQTLLETLEVEGVLITMDVLHAQKNASAD